MAKCAAVQACSSLLQSVPSLPPLEETKLTNQKFFEGKICSLQTSEICVNNALMAEKRMQLTLATFKCVSTWQENPNLTRKRVSRPKGLP